MLMPLIVWNDTIVDLVTTATASRRRIRASGSAPMKKQFSNRYEALS